MSDFRRGDRVKIETDGLPPMRIIEIKKGGLIICEYFDDNGNRKTFATVAERLSHHSDEPQALIYGRGTQN